MTQQPSARWLASLGVDKDQVHAAVSALSVQDQEAVATAARAPLGELVEIDQHGQPAGPLPVSESLAASGCVFAVLLNEGEYPREHHWLTHLGWAVARQMQPTADWNMPADAENLQEFIIDRRDVCTRGWRQESTATLGVLLHRTMGQFALCVAGTNPKTVLLTRVCQSALCELIDARVGGSPTPLTAGGYEDAATEMVRQAIITIPLENDEAAFTLSDMAGIPEAYADRHRLHQERLEALRRGAQD